jgi:hypothetical protein
LDPRNTDSDAYLRSITRKLVARPGVPTTDSVVREGLESQLQLLEALIWQALIDEVDPPQVCATCFNIVDPPTIVCACLVPVAWPASDVAMKLRLSLPLSGISR